MHPAGTKSSSGTQLDQGDLEALLVETMWRVPAGACVALPSLLTETLLKASTREELDFALEAVKKYASRADLRLIPILASGHWTLLPWRAFPSEERASDTFDSQESWLLCQEKPQADGEVHILFLMNWIIIPP